MLIETGYAAEHLRCRMRLFLILTTFATGETLSVGPVKSYQSLHLSLGFNRFVSHGRLIVVLFFGYGVVLLHGNY